MVESAAQFVDHVFSEVPVRQFVLTFPMPLRFLLAAQPQALSQVLAVVPRGISTNYRIAIGPQAGRKALTRYSVPALEEAANHPLLARAAGFSLHAATVCEAYQRGRIVPRRARRQGDSDKPLAPMNWPLSHLPALRGTGTSCPMAALAPPCASRHRDLLSNGCSASNGCSPSLSRPALIAKILAQVQRREYLTGNAPREPPADRQPLNLT
jgi:hypothetical protein